MACNQQILGYSNLSASEACRNYYVNPTTFSLDGLLGDNPNLVVNKIIYQDSNCSVQAPSGFYSDGFVVRYYTTNNLEKSGNCGKSNLFKYCCDGTLFRLENIGDYYPGGLPQGVSLYLTISNNINQFNGCFESVLDEGQSLSYNIVEFLGGLYTNCQVCLSTNKPTCLLSAGTYEFKSCLNDDIQYFDITTNYLFYSGSVVTYTGTCYSLVSASTETPVTSFSAITYTGCSDTNCVPTPTPIPVSSIYAQSCCDDRIYKLISGQPKPIGNVYSLPPSDFCYSIISQPTALPSNLQSLNDQNFILVDNCGSVGCQKCPDILPTGDTANECEPVTLFPLGLTCDVVNPTLENPFGGILSLIITGGTSPYTVVWTPGGTGSTLYNQPAGTYVATVTDYWGDFVEKITCTLEGPLVCDFNGSITPFIPPTPTPSPSPSPSPTPSPTPIPGCVTYEITNPYSNIQYPLVYIDCYDDSQSYLIAGSEVYIFCAIEDSVVCALTPVEMGVCIPPTPTPTPTLTPTPTPSPSPTPVSACKTVTISNPTDASVSLSMRPCKNGIPTAYLIYSIPSFGTQTICTDSIQTNPLPFGIITTTGSTCFN